MIHETDKDPSQLMSFLEKISRRFTCPRKDNLKKYKNVITKFAWICRDSHVDA